MNQYYSIGQFDFGKQFDVIGQQTDQAVQQAVKEQDSGFSFDDFTGGLKSFADALNPFVQTGAQFYQQQQQLDLLEKQQRQASNQGQSTQAAQLQNQIAELKQQLLLQQAQQAQQRPQQTPSWVMPVVVLGGVGVLGIAFVMLMRKK